MTIAQDEGGCDNRYRTATCVWGTEPDPILEELAQRVPLHDAKVLDAGCGEGRHAAFLARQGARVLATDVSELAIERAARTFPDERIVWACADLRAMPAPEATYDGVVNISVLHWLRSEPEARTVLDRLRGATRPGGWHVVVAFNAREPYHLTGPDTREPYLLDHDWFREQYAGWELVSFSDTDLAHAHTGHEEQHTHAVTQLIALRPVA
jgi:2-polyprenyl-3-methyl-5-hydroxy-6-metoxy-1,4-benzoquinol methylase